MNHWDNFKSVREEKRNQYLAQVKKEGGKRWFFTGRNIASHIARTNGGMVYFETGPELVRYYLTLKTPFSDKPINLPLEHEEGTFFIYELLPNGEKLFREDLMKEIFPDFQNKNSKAQ